MVREVRVGKATFVAGRGRHFGFLVSWDAMRDHRGWRLYYLEVSLPFVYIGMEWG